MTHPHRPQCLIMGCALAMEESGLYTWGDLYTLGKGVWIHNASGLSGVPRALPTAHLNAEVKIILVPPNTGIFTRSGVTTFFRDQVKLNEAAKACLEGDPYAE